MTKDNCWELVNGSFRTPLMVTSIQIYDHLMNEWHELENVVVDTGYDGDVFLNYEVYERLGFRMVEMPATMFTKAEGINGKEISLRGTITSVKWANKQHETRVETFQGNSENIIGRGLLLRASHYYTKEKKEFCVNACFNLSENSVK